MSILDLTLYSAKFSVGEKEFASDIEMMIHHIDGVDSMGFTNHFKLPHYVTFQADLQVFSNAADFAKDKKLNHANFLTSHKLSSKHILSPSRQGKYRAEAVGVFGNEGLVYSAIEGFLVENEMNTLFSIIDERLKTKMTPAEAIFWASWIHLEIALIHPFLDGNGRSARLIEKWFLSEKLGRSIWFLQTERAYFEKRTKYYSSLKNGTNYWELKPSKFNTFITLLFSFIK